MTARAAKPTPHIPSLPLTAMGPADYLKKILTARVYDVAVESALEPARNLSERLHNTVLLKREDQQPVFSFKLRGAYNKMAHLTPEQLKAMVPIRALRGRPPSPNKKQLVSIRYSPEVLEYFKSTGDGWQAHIEAPWDAGQGWWLHALALPAGYLGCLATPFPSPLIRFQSLAELTSSARVESPLPRSIVTPKGIHHGMHSKSALVQRRLYS